MPGAIAGWGSVCATKSAPPPRMRVTTPAFAAMTMELLAVAEECCGGRIVAVTEGGYDLHALAASIEGVLEALSGSASDARWPSSGIPSTRGRASVEAAKRALT